jgi:hypothetical protein
MRWPPADHDTADGADHADPELPRTPLITLITRIQGSWSDPRAAGRRAGP